MAGIEVGYSFWGPEPISGVEILEEWDGMAGTALVPSGFKSLCLMTGLWLQSPFSLGFKCKILGGSSPSTASSLCSSIMNGDIITLAFPHWSLELGHKYLVRRMWCPNHSD